MSTDLPTVKEKFKICLRGCNTLPFFPIAPALIRDVLNVVLNHRIIEEEITEYVCVRACVRVDVEKICDFLFEPLKQYAAAHY